MDRELMTSIKYDSKDTPLTSTVFARILVTLYNGKRFRRCEAIEAVKAYHSSHGGLLQRSDYTSAFKRATQKIIKDYVTNVGYGEWIINYPDVDEADSADESESPIISSAPIDLPSLEIDEVIGTGSQSVYVYYFKSQKITAETAKTNVWPCKIGMTTTSVVQRVSTICRTGFPELPILSLEIKTDKAKELENIIHDVLDYNDRHLDCATGTEWFLTNPEEIKEIYERITMDKPVLEGACLWI